MHFSLSGHLHFCLNHVPLCQFYNIHLLTTALCFLPQANFGTNLQISGGMQRLHLIRFNVILNTKYPLMSGPARSTFVTWWTWGEEANVIPVAQWVNVSFASQMVATGRLSKPWWGSETKYSCGELDSGSRLAPKISWNYRMTFFPSRPHYLIEI